MPSIKIFNNLLLSLSLMSGLAFAGNGLFSLASDEPEFLRVDQAFVFNFLQNKQGVELSWQVRPEHYLYKDRISFTVDGLTLGTIDYPKAKPYQDEYFGEVDIYEHSFSLQVALSQISENNHFSVSYQGCAKAGLCYPPKTQILYIDSTFQGGTSPHATDLDEQALSGQETALQSEPLDKPATSDKLESAQPVDKFSAMSLLDKLTDLQYLTQVLESQSLLVILLLFFVVGLGLAFTPCVYPMFPILSRIIVGQSQSGLLSTRRAFHLSFFYVQGMALTYMLLGVLAAFVGAGINATLQQPVVIVPAAILFVLLALSMFGFYNLSLPASWQQKLNKMSDKQKGGSIGGVFIMGAISGLVCSPCATAPLVAVIAYIAQSQDMLLGGTILYVLALGMGLPLLVIGTGGASLLPKAGAWMDLIKAVFGFALLSVAIVFIARLVDSTISSLLWAALAMSAVTYFYHQNQLSKAGAWQSTRTIFLLLALFFSALFAYKALFPAATAQLTLRTSSQQGSHFIQVRSVAALEAQLVLAEQQGKRVMLDYYADWCVACKEFEDKTFSDAKVQGVFNDMILIQADVTQVSEQNSALQKKYDVFGLPSLIFIEDQQELSHSRVTGFMEASRFLRHVTSIP